MLGMREYTDACYERRQFLAKQQEWLNDEWIKYQDDSEQIRKTRERIRQETIGYLLPEISDSYLQELEKKLSYPSLLKTKNAYDAKFKQVEVRRAELEASDDIKFYDLNLNRIQEVINDLQPAYDSAIDRRKLWEKNPRFKNLSSRGFFSEEGSRGWWNAILNWRDVSLLMGLLRKGGERYNNPTEVKQQYRLFKDQSEQVVAAYENKVAENNRLVELKKELATLLKQPQQLLADLYQDLGKQILDHLDACPEEVRVKLAEKDPYLDTFFRKSIGTQKQIDYLHELSVTRIDSQREQLNQELIKLDDKIRKLNSQMRRGKRKVFTPEQIAQMRDYKPEKWEKRRAQVGEVRERIHSFDNYNSGSLLERYLWWDLITRGMNGNDVVEVRHFHDTNPGWDYRAHSNLSSSGDNDFDNAAESLAASMSTPADDAFKDAT